MGTILEKEIKDFALNYNLCGQLFNSNFLITGATGLIGSILTKCLLSLNQDIEITIPVRNRNKAKLIYGEDRNIHIIESDLLAYCNNINEHFDYIIHCASPTSGEYISKYPVETFELAIETTRSLLNYAKYTKIKSMVYISSIEYYGQIFDDRLITEDSQGYVDYSSPRSAYPLGKRAAEYLCTSYALEYDIPVKVARLTQTFGAGVSQDDNRVFAQFAKSIINGTDIILHTKGDSAKPYCYTIDSVSAILFILLKGIKGQAYNVANEDTYISIFEMATFLRDTFNPKINVRIEEHPEMGYAPVTKLRLSTKKLRELGWSPMYNLKEMFSNLIDSLN